jgi:membrane protease YdiL (CAAX protease family)
MYPKKFWECFLVLVFSFATPVLVIVAIFPQLKPTSGLFHMLYCLGLGGCSLLITFFINKKKGIILSFNIIPKFSKSVLLWAFFNTVVYIAGKSFFVNYFTPFSYNHQENSLMLLLSFCLLGPIAEELIFRGICLKGLLLGNKYSTGLSICGISVLFALIHFNVAPQANLLNNAFTVLNALILSLYMSWLFYKTMNLGITVIIHILANSLTLIINYAFSIFQKQLQLHTLLFVTVGVCLVLLSTAGFIVLKNKIK